MALSAPNRQADRSRRGAIGHIGRGRILVVHAERGEDTVRIISARWASKKERVLYLEYMEKQS